MPNEQAKTRPRLLYRLYERRLVRELADAVVPCHVGVILDGNRRWARKQRGEVAEGHRAGAAKIGDFLQWCDDAGVEVVTLYLLSEDNIAGRDPEEIQELFLIISDLCDELSRVHDWRLFHVGSGDTLSPVLRESLQAVEARTAANTGMSVNLAVGYGGRREIADAVRSILTDGEESGLSLAEIADRLTPELISQHLYTGGQPDPDLILRTSGEQRLSDFLLWQSAHSEFYFADVLWPDFRRIDFLRALRDFAHRQRRFGS